MDELDLRELGQGNISAITPAIGNLLAEAAAVCLESQGHTQEVILDVDGNIHARYSLKWRMLAGEKVDTAWNDADYATEHGAAAIAIMLAKQVIGYDVIERSRRGTGIDYWLGEASDVTYQSKARLEVSGIRRGDNVDIQRRLTIKLAQTMRSDTMRGGLPVYVVIIEFSKPVAEVHDR